MIINSYIFQSYDVDAQAYFTAANITNTTEKKAVNDLVLDMKSYGIWSKCIAIYPYRGSAASSTKFNLKNPLDTNAAFRILWSGGTTHNYSGVTGNGTNGFGNTNIQHSASTSQNDVHISFWSRTDIQTAIPDMGIDDSLRNIGLYITPRNASNLALHKVQDNTASSTANTIGSGFYVTSRTASNSKKLYKNGVILHSSTTASVSTLSGAIIPVLGRSNYNGMNGYVAKNHSFGSVGQGLTDTEVANFYTAVNKYMTTLGI